MVRSGVVAATLAIATIGAFAHPPSAGDRDDATIAYLESRLATSPRDRIVLSMLGAARLAVARRSGDHEDLAKAEEVFRRLLDVEPASRSGRAGLAYGLFGSR